MNLMNIINKFKNLEEKRTKDNTRVLYRKAQNQKLEDFLWDLEIETIEFIDLDKINN